VICSVNEVLRLSKLLIKDIQLHTP